MMGPAVARELPPPLELECLKALWGLGEASVRQVQDAIAPNRQLAYTTVMTVMDRLARRGCVQRKKFADGSKDFPTSRPDGRGGWIYKLDDVRRVLYRLPAVRAAQFVFVCEGEKVADRINAALEEAGRFGEYVATTNPHGGGKWRDEFAGELEGKTVGVLPDNDDPGAAHAETARTLPRSRR